MKKMICLLLALTLVLCGCAGAGASATTEAATTAPAQSFLLRHDQGAAGRARHEPVYHP